MRVDGRTVIPVARVRTAGGAGQRGGGGRLDAAPVGFIDMSADGARFEPIGGAPRAARALAAGGVALTGVAAAAALRRRRRVVTRLRATLPRRALALSGRTAASRLGRPELPRGVRRRLLSR